VVGEEYCKVISGAKIALSFLSKINRDTYTRRNFQIPAVQTFMLSEYSEDLASLFAEGEEAEYFRSREELLEKVGFYLRNEFARNRIARKGHERLVAGGHDVTSRMRDFLLIVQGARRRGAA
jgi:spore maturation protein CgeB